MLYYVPCFSFCDCLETQLILKKQRYLYIMPNCFQCQDLGGGAVARSPWNSRRNRQRRWRGRWSSQAETKRCGEAGGAESKGHAEGAPGHRQNLEIWQKAVPYASGDGNPYFHCCLNTCILFHKIFLPPIARRKGFPGGSVVKKIHVPLQ